MNPGEDEIQKITVELSMKPKEGEEEELIRGSLDWVTGAAGYVWHLSVNQRLWGQFVWSEFRGFRFSSNTLPDDLFTDILEFYVISWYQ